MNKLLKDLYITKREFGAQQSNREYADISVSKGGLTLGGGRQNLTQAVLNRLFTRKGELAGLGHPNYGSRLYTLIGQPNNKRSRALAELFIRECLDEEPRIEEINRIVVEEPQPRQIRRDVMQITMAVVPVDDHEPIVLSMSMNLEG